ncbi:MAG TPA: hypothetical protein VGX25_33785 [Actinophytocola sp.]|uniref:hypothetical protein n=1 Tax=Actinophytocola sp. TaxID=1872138 RepID=UPI002DDDB2B5|nr:hypothetical protein [Actinophytocola sp.]HEV2784385.1 hypothetical protein [Actinophytocola sp.]
MPVGAHRSLSVLAWLAVPLLFAAAVLGLTGLGGVLLSADWRVTLSSALFGPAAAVTAVLAHGVEWRAQWQRWSLGLAYPAVVFAAGLVLNDVSLPAPLAMAAGAPALITLVVVVAREHNKVVPIA